MKTRREECAFCCCEDLLHVTLIIPVLSVSFARFYSFKHCAKFCIALFLLFVGNFFTGLMQYSGRKEQVIAAFVTPLSASVDSVRW